VLLVSSNGTARQLRWPLPDPPADATYSFSLGDPFETLQVDLLSDGSVDSVGVPAVSIVNELPPTIIAVEQSLEVNVGRPPQWCVGPDYANYGTVVGVVFSKPVTQDSAGNADSYTIDGGNGANSVRVQPGGRVAYLNLRQPISAIIPRTVTLSGVTDQRGNLVVGNVQPIVSERPGEPGVPFTDGVTVAGRVLRGDGAPVIGVPVTLTMFDQVQTPFDCQSWTKRISQVFTDAGGNFTFDFVMGGVPYSISTTDTSGLSGEEIQLILQTTSEGRVQREVLEGLATAPETRDTLLGLFATGSLPQAIAKAEGLDRAVIRDFVPLASPRFGQTVPFVLQFRGRATVAGQVVSESGSPIPEAAVNLYPDPDSRELGRGLFADTDGRFAFFGVPLGIYTVDVKTSDRRFRTVAGLIETPGATTNLVIVVPDQTGELATLRGQVLEPGSNLPHPNARVFIGSYNPGANTVEG
ncbi:MAG TPA: carboxypeptidase-like regulatory domain-containing protein, partial [Verrucomicrobiae bacterium]|nr:carboxypeptidase-like regulatory domain-containing protein [Verrucomicrobiae bacterium]